MPTVSADAVEHKVQDICFRKRVRLKDFFEDYDKLRSGYVTRSQFERALQIAIDTTLPEAELACLADKFDSMRNGQINYQQLVRSVQRHIDEMDLNFDPRTQLPPEKEYFGTDVSVKPLDPESEQMVHQLLVKIMDYLRIHGMDIRSAYQDFDVQNNGKVTESQFYRNFPCVEIKGDKFELLVRKYRDPEHPGLVVYLNMHRDIKVLEERFQDINISTPGMGQDQQLAMKSLEQTSPVPTVDDLINQCKVCAYKYGIRTHEFFKDYDRLNSGACTERQFISGLSLALAERAGLSPENLLQIADYFRNLNGSIRYKDFCDIIESAFMVPSLEKQPTAYMVPPGKGELGRKVQVNDLSSEERQRLMAILTQMQDRIRTERIQVYQYFKDYDRGKCYSRVMTPSQFSRVLSSLRLIVNDNDLKLLCKAFCHPPTGDVNYPAFVQSVDDLFRHSTSEPTDQESWRHPFDGVHGCGDGKPLDPLDSVDTSDVNFDTLMARIRHIALTRRLRVKEFFEEFDPLRSGRVTKNQFRRILSNLSLCKLGEHDLTDAQFKRLCEQYSDQDAKDKVKWREFVDDVESAVFVRNLERYPDLRMPAPETFLVPKPGTSDWRNASEEHRTSYAAGVDSLKMMLQQRRLLCAPFFQNFDKHNQGHITRQNFRQAMAMLNLSMTDAQRDAIEARHCNDIGFDYRSFLEELQPADKIKHVYPERLEEVRKTNKAKHAQDKNKDGESEVAEQEASDLDSIMMKVKSIVYEKRPRLKDICKIFDKHNQRRINRNQFRRALDQAHIVLTERELDVIEDHFAGQGNDMVDYYQFAEEMESIFAQNELEKRPLHEPDTFKPMRKTEQNRLTVAEENDFMNGMRRVAEKVRKYRMQLYPLFEDFDRTHSGYVSKNQFARVLSELGLDVRSKAEFDAIVKQFEAQFGGRKDINYIDFSRHVYDAAGIPQAIP